MAINWQLKAFLAKQHDIYRPTDLQKRVAAKTNVLVSLSNISKLMSQRPSQIKLSTMELLCTTFDCCLSDFCQIKPSTRRLPEGVRKLSYKNATKKGASDFPDPKEYE